MKTHAIFTASDDGCGEFLIEHWLRSLYCSVDLSEIDVHVLDYGLTTRQRDRLTSAGVTCHQLPKDGFVSTVRVRDLPMLLQNYQYDQVLMCDAGDLIFQADISHLFEQDKNEFRAVCEQIDSSIHQLVMPRGDLARDRFQEITDFLHGKPTINGGVLLGPAKRFHELWAEFVQLSAGTHAYATDQLLLNYKLHREGFVELEPKYNFVVITMRDRFIIRQGVFCDSSGNVIPIVHNAGGKDVFRCVERFGFGKHRNRRKRVTPLIMRLCFGMMKLYRGRWQHNACTSACNNRKAKTVT